MRQLKEEFVYIQSGKYSIPLFVGLPPSRDKKYPVVVFCHGFGGTKTEVFRHFFRLSRKLYNEGFLTVRFDFTGFGDSLAPTTAFSISQGTEDIKAIVNWLNNEQLADMSRLNLLGFSLGSLIAAESVGAGLDVRSLCLVCPVEHYVVHRDVSEESDNDYQENNSIWYSGYELSNLFVGEYINSKGSKHLDGKKIPVQLIQGSADQTVPSDHYEEYKRVIDCEKVKPLLIDGGDHTFSEKIFQDMLDDKVIEFFNSQNDIH